MCKFVERELGKLRNNKRSRAGLSDIHGNHDVGECEARGNSVLLTLLGVAAGVLPPYGGVGEYWAGGVLGKSVFFNLLFPIPFFPPISSPSPHCPFLLPALKWL